MPYAINMRCDNESANPIKALWDAASALEETPSMAPMNYPPHLTLAVYDDIASSELSESVRGVFAGVQSQRVRFQTLGMFETETSIILWAKPEISHELVELHGKLHDNIGEALCRPNYRPSTWVPHCSLATAVPKSRKADALAFISREIATIDVRFDVVDCARFHPVEVIHEVALLPTRRALHHPRSKTDPNVPSSDR